MITAQYNLASRLGAARDQGRRPTCLLFALSALNRYEHRIEVPLCVEHLARQVEVQGSSWRRGVSIYNGIGALRTAGQGFESVYPYDGNVLDRPLQPPPPSRDDRYSSHVIEIPAKSASVRDALAEGSICGLAIKVTDCQFSVESDGIVRPAPTESAHGLHAVAAVGWGTCDHDGTDYVLVRNSWGTEWGDQGHAWFDVTYLDEILLNCIRARDGFII